VRRRRNREALFRCHGLGNRRLRGPAHGHAAGTAHPRTLRGYGQVPVHPGRQWPDLLRPGRADPLLWPGPASGEDQPARAGRGDVLLASEGRGVCAPARP